MGTRVKIRRYCESRSVLASPFKQSRAVSGQARVEAKAGTEADASFLMAKARRSAGKQRVIFWFNVRLTFIPVGIRPREIRSPTRAV